MFRIAIGVRIRIGEASVRATKGGHIDASVSASGPIPNASVHNRRGGRGMTVCRPSVHQPPFTVRRPRIRRSETIGRSAGSTGIVPCTFNYTNTHSLRHFNHHQFHLNTHPFHPPHPHSPSPSNTFSMGNVTIVTIQSSINKPNNQIIDISMLIFMIKLTIHFSINYLSLPLSFIIIYELIKELFIIIIIIHYLTN